MATSPCHRSAPDKTVCSALPMGISTGLKCCMQRSRPILAPNSVALAHCLRSHRWTQVQYSDGSTQSPGPPVASCVMYGARCSLLCFTRRITTVSLSLSISCNREAPVPNVTTSSLRPVFAPKGLPGVAKWFAVPSPLQSSPALAPLPLPRPSPRKTGPYFYSTVRTY